MKKYLLSCLLLATTVLQAQEKEPVPNHSKAFTLNLPALAMIDYTFLPGVEFRMKPRLFLAAEAGYIFASDYLPRNNGNSDRKASGFILRPSLKIFFNESQRGYIQPQAFYKQVTHKMYDWLGKGVVNNVASYEQLQNFKYRRKIIGGNVILGTVLPLKLPNIFVDFYAGFGVRKKTNRVVGESQSSYQRIPAFGNSDNADNGIFPSIPAGIRFVYAFK